MNANLASPPCAKAWSPYLGGALSGLVIVASVWIAGKYFGASTTFVRAAAAVEQAVAPDYVARLAYFAKEGAKIDWQGLFLVGVFLGALAAALMSRTFVWTALPQRWEQRFGPSRVKRAAVAFVGGAVAMFGARLADGCPSGHGLSGMSQLAVSGYLAGAGFFAGGILMARLLYRGK